MQWLKDRALAVLLLIGGCAALAITVAVNKHFGVQQAATSEGQLLSGSMTVFIDIALVLLGITSGALWRSKDKTRKAVGAFTFFLMIACALASVTSVLGFLGAERLSVTKAREKQEQIAEAKRAAAAAAEKQARDAQIEVAKDNAKWMQTQTQGRGMGRAERKDLRKDVFEGLNKQVEVIGKVAVAPPAVEKPTEIMLRPDGQVELIADMTGINRQTLQLTILAYMSILLIVLKSSFFPLGAYMWGPKDGGLPQSVTDPIRHGLPDEAHVTVMAGPALEPPPGQRMLPAPLSRPEPPPEGKAVLARIGFPKVKPDTERAMTDEERETIGLRLLTWMTAHGIRGEFAHDALWACMQEYFIGAGLVPCAERIAKPALASVNKGRKYYATKTETSPVVWSIRLPDFEELNGLLDRYEFPAAPKASRTKAEKVSPTEPAQPQKEEAAPETAPSNVISAPFAGSEPAPAPSTKPVKGLAEMQRFFPNIDAMRSIGRVEKRQWQARIFSQDRKQGNRMRRARSA